MNRIQAVYAIGDLLDKQCAGCPKRADLNKQYGSSFSQIDGYCNRECPVGQQLQSFGQQLGRGAESETDNLRCWSKPETSCGTSELSSLLAPKCNSSAEISYMA
ncbi:hypothetical protein J2T12_005077 [Paenibacillus anaericanus]|uniref:zinc-finger domain-containing protein n=1 Tax=Paenibacillus anaericanus TaxID=170367 RepID=UPI0027869C88|nr:zinc-finger domain-containing protein [Paenibacillus anaericanus]MDQ0091637.1 hypothetical protein [Paenibacillus anaericanus]